MASKRSKPRKRAPRAAPPPPAQAINVEVVDSRIRSWLPRLTLITATLATLAALYGAYRWLGLPIFVDTSTLHETVNSVETKLRSQIGETKIEVIGHTDKNTKEVKEDVGGVKKQIEIIARKQDQSAVTALELQARQLFLQRANLLNSISSVELQLQTRKNDVFLMQRKAELESIKGNIERESEAVNDQLRRARAGNQ